MLDVMHMRHIMRVGKIVAVSAVFARALLSASTLRIICARRPERSASFDLAFRRHLDIFVARVDAASCSRPGRQAVIVRNRVSF